MLQKLVTSVTMVHAPLCLFVTLTELVRCPVVPTVHPETLGPLVASGQQQEGRPEAAKAELGLGDSTVRLSPPYPAGGDVQWEA